MKKQDIKLAAKLWVASMAIQADAGFLGEEVGLTEKEVNIFINEANELGRRMLSKHPEFTRLEDIVKYIYNTYYE